MAEHFVDLMGRYLAHYGYWAVGIALLLENAGLPVPGETVLLLASFLSFSEHRLRLSTLMMVGTLAAALGDNLGFAIGHYGGRPLLERYGRAFRISSNTMRRGQRIFQRYGSATILFARFVFGLRVIAGPLAGVMGMHWKRFAVFNVLGAAIWVMAISTIGYSFGQHWSLLAHYIKGLDLLIALVALLAFYFLWRHPSVSGASKE